MPLTKAEIDALVGPTSDENQTDTLTTYRAVEQNPQDVADAARISRESGKPATVLLDNIEQARLDSRVRAVESAFADAPELGELRRDPAFITSVKDEPEKIGKFKQLGINLMSAVNKLTGGAVTTAGVLGTKAWEATPIGAFEKVYQQQLEQYKEQNPQQAKEVDAELERLTQWQNQNVARKVARAGVGIMESADLDMKPLMPWEDVKRADGALDTTLAGAGFVAEQTVYSAPEMAVAYFAPWLIAGSYTGQVGAERAQRRGQQDVGFQDIAEAAPAGLAISLLNKYGADRVLGSIEALERTALRRIGTAAVAEGTTEVAQEELQYVAERYGIDPLDMQEMKDLILPTFIGAAGAGGAIRGMVEASVAAGEKLSKQAVTDADERKQLVDQLASLSEAAKLRETMPDGFAAMVDKLAPGTELYIDADVAETLNQDDFTPDMIARMEESIEAGTPVRFTAAEYATYLAPQAAKLSDKVRVGSAAAINSEEAQNIEKEFAARAEAAISAADNADVLRTEGEQIHRNVSEQIVSTGRFRRDVADAYATLIRDFFTTTAARVGTTPAELFKQYPLRVQAANQNAQGLAQAPTSLMGARVKRTGLNSVDDLWKYVQNQLSIGTPPPSLAASGKSTQQLAKDYVRVNREALEGGPRTVTIAGQEVQLTPEGGLQAFAREAISTRWGKELTARAGLPATADSIVQLYEFLRDGSAREVADNTQLSPVAHFAENAGKVPQGFTRFKHFGNQRVGTLDPRFYGTGARGAERQRTSMGVISLYPESITAQTKEVGTGNNEYVVDVPTSRLYDVNEDPQGFKAAARRVIGERGDGTPIYGDTIDFSRVEQAIKDAGYLGYVAPRAEGILQGQARLFDAVPVVSGALNQLPANEFVVRNRGDIGVQISAPDKATLLAEVNGSSLQIRAVSVADSVKGQGVGQQLIEQASAVAKQRGLRLKSDSQVSVAQLHVYEALKRRGWRIEYTDPENVAAALAGRTAGYAGEPGFDGPPVVRAIEPPAQNTLNQSAVELPSIIADNLTAEEQARVTKRAIDNLIETFDKLPSADDFAEAAQAGGAMRGWYGKANDAIRSVFGDTDAPRFAATLAAFSPQVPVQRNLENATKVWAAWDAAGRPTERDAIVQVINDGLAPTKPLGAWVENAVRALSAEDGTEIKLSGAKVDSFMRNLYGDAVAVTIDTWMAKFALLDAQDLSTGTKKGAIKEKNATYLAYSARVRETARLLSERTGEEWTPAQVQETVWSWVLTATQLADAMGEARSIAELVADGVVSDQAVADTPSLGAMILDNANVFDILEKAGYGEQLKAFRDAGASSDGRRAPPPSARLLEVAARLDAARAEQAAREETLEQTEAEQLPQNEARLPGAPADPIPELVAVAEKYAADNGIPYQRQPEYVDVNPVFARDLAAAYDAMPHDPQNPEVREAYQDLIRQTRAQYDALVDAGFSFTFFDSKTDPYGGNPWNAMRDLRANKTMAVYGTYDGFGTSEFDPSTNPLLENTGLVWPDQDGKPHPVLANDLFRAVHDAFGHGLEGAGFRARGEENAWQAHSLLFTGPALAALTTETRGQNSWLNFGPHGEKNRTAKVEDTVFADQKTGLLPRWAWGNRAADIAEQSARGNIMLGQDLTATPALITLFEKADLSTFLHESGHFFLEVMTDLAARPNAPAEIVDDAQKLFDWVGFKGTAAEWRATNLNERREAHEQFARGFEAYLLEGKAPNQELRTLFHRFRAWMLNVYKSITRLNVQLTDEVRQTMDRMIATSDQIAAAEAARRLQPLFKDAAAAGMDEQTWQQYQQMAQDATNNAQDQLQTRSLKNLRWLTNAKAKELSKLQAQNKSKRDAIKAEIEQLVAQQPERVAETLLLSGEVWVNVPGGEPQQLKIDGPHKLSTERLAALYGTTEDYRQVARDAGMEDVQGIRAPWHSLPKNLVAKDGIDPDLVAEMTGFTSGDELVQRLLKMPDRETLVNQLTDQEVLRRHGDLNDASTMERAVDIALHNQMRTRMVATELAALEGAQQVGGRRDALRRAAREFAERVIQRKKIRDLRPGQYAAGEAKAAKLAMEAIASGDSRTAARHKRDQLFNGYASRAASRAQDSIETQLRYLRKFSNNETRKNLEIGYRNQIDKLLERYSLRAASNVQLDKRDALSKWIEEQRAQGHEPAISDELMDESQRINYRNMTVEQFDGLVDAVKNIEHLARLKHKLLKNKHQRDFDTAKAELTASLLANAPKAKPVELERESSTLGKAADFIRDWFTSLRKLSSLTRVMDGVKDGGAAWEYFVRPLNDAADAETEMRAEATKKLNKLFDMVPGLNPNFVARGKQKISGNPQLFIPAINKSLSLHARIAVALNAGNEGNLKRLTDGNKWTVPQVQAVIDTLTKQEMDFVQGVLDFIDSYWSQIKAKEERVSGIAPGKVDASPIRTRYGEYRGGYYPIVADPLRSDKAAQQNDAELISQSLKGAVGRATTRRGHTKERVGGQDPIRLDLGVIVQHISQVTHDLAWHETLIDYNKMLRDPQVSTLIRDHYGPETTQFMRRVSDDVARGEVGPRGATERMLNYMRVGSTISGLGLSVTTTMLQFTGITQSIVRVGAKTVAHGYGLWMSSPKQSTEKVYEKSAFMRSRDQVQNRELSDIFNRMDGKKNTLAKLYFWPIQAMQKVVDIPTWLGTYNEALARGENDEKAIALADQAVTDAQASGRIHDLSEIQRGGPLLKLFTNFYSYFSSTYQLATESARRAGKEKSLASAVNLATDYLLLFAIPVVLGTLIREGLRGDLPDEPEELAQELGTGTITYVLGMFPIIREVSGALDGFSYQGPAGLSMLSNVSGLAQQAAQGELDEAFWRSLNRTAGTLLHYPSSQLERTVRGAIAISEGDAPPQALLVGPPRE